MIGIDLDDNQLLLAVLALLGGIIGIVTSLQNPVAGFLITGGTVMLAVVGVTVNLSRLVNDRLPNMQRPTGEREHTVIYGAFTLLAFIPLLLPELVLAVGLGILLYGVIKLYEHWEAPGKLTEDQIMDFLQSFLGAAVFVFVSQYRGFLVLPIIVLFSIFLWSLLPDDTKDDIRVWEA